MMPEDTTSRIFIGPRRIAEAFDLKEAAGALGQTACWDRFDLAPAKRIP
jgi:hypothetical protein